MTDAERLGRFVRSISFEDIPKETVDLLKTRVLDSLGVAIGAIGSEVEKKVRAQVEEFGGNALSTLIGGGMSAPDRVAFYNGALVRYLDFMDSYLAPGETFHPSDNLGAVLATAEYADATGKEFLTALAVAYEVQARLSEAAPLRARGFDHTTQGAYAAACGVSKALSLDLEKTSNAIAMSGTANNALRVTRTGKLSNWKGLAYPNTAASATALGFLAMRGITGPLEVFEGKKGFAESIAGPFRVDWDRKSFDGITRSVVKKYNAEVHAQSAIEGVLELQLKADDIRSVEVETFQVAYDIIGGGEEGAKTEIRTKEEADHSLPYMIAVALIDGALYPEQYFPERIVAPDVQSLLRKIHIRPNEHLSRRFPAEMPVRISIELRDGRRLEVEKSDYEGFFTRPMSWGACEKKCRRLAGESIGGSFLSRLFEVIRDLDELRVRDLTSVLSFQTQSKRRSA